MNDSKLTPLGAAMAHAADTLAALDGARAELAKAEAQAEPARKALSDLQAEFHATGNAELVAEITKAEQAVALQGRFHDRAISLVAEAERAEAEAKRSVLQAEHAEALEALSPARIDADLAPFVDRLVAANRERFEVFVAVQEFGDEWRARWRRAAELARQIGAVPPREDQAHTASARVIRQAGERLKADVPVHVTREPRRYNALIEAMR
ncbi:MAG: hypothetical protein HS104_14350 [Polyangiaceae bacterium]|nr:hypothetical protein [Polyangiaceae bacterium]MCL4748908.1 hypothetical protein [Myxococcales bacterium]